jgi:hypothetical protein
MEIAESYHQYLADDT